jgi:predicted RNase H-like nuclease
VRALDDVTTIAIIGIDCAAQAKNTGLAYAIPKGEQLAVQDARCASNDATASSIIRDWVRDLRHVLLALDAPLGWPTAFSRALASHRAGEPLGPTAHVMFRRLTDDEICERLGKRPLEVAADRIARAAHAALRLLDELRHYLAVDIPLVWSPSWHGGLGAIEVYPAATRIALGVPHGGGSLTGLESRLSFGTTSLPASEHARDALVCAVAAQEFLSGRAVAPTNAQMVQARQEGWIWAGPSVAQRADR